MNKAFCLFCYFLQTGFCPFEFMVIQFLSNDNFAVKNKKWLQKSHLQFFQQVMSVTLFMAMMSGNVQSLLQWSPDNSQLLRASHTLKSVFCVCLCFFYSSVPAFPYKSVLSFHILMKFNTFQTLQISLLCMPSLLSNTGLRDFRVTCF